jgi:hypothetical protein
MATDIFTWHGTNIIRNCIIAKAHSRRVGFNDELPMTGKKELSVSYRSSINLKMVTWYLYIEMVNLAMATW